MTESNRKRWSTVEVVTVLANIGVLVGLMFVGFQLRLGQRTLEAEVQLGIGSAYQELASRVIENSDLRVAMETAVSTPDSLDAQELLQLTNHFAEWTSFLFTIYELRNKGVITNAMWTQHATYFALSLFTPWLHEFWRGNFLPAYPVEFIDEVESFSRDH